MIKKNASKDMFYAEIVHTINSLYKIKILNRKLNYTDAELKLIVLNDPIGVKTLTTLSALGVTRETLINYNLNFFLSIFGDYFPAK